jgi:translation initiation factor 3 subunit E
LAVTEQGKAILKQLLFMTLCKEKVYQCLKELRAGCKSLYDLSQNTQERAKLMASGQWNVASLIENSSLNISQETIETFRLLAKYNYECGDYQTA